MGVLSAVTGAASAATATTSTTVAAAAAATASAAAATATTAATATASAATVAATTTSTTSAETGCRRGLDRESREDTGSHNNHLLSIGFANLSDTNRISVSEKIKQSSAGQSGDHLPHG